MTRRTASSASSAHVDAGRKRPSGIGGMCKAAENERIKLKAAYFNNIAVGLWVAGGLVPYLVFIQRAGELVEWIMGWLSGTSQFKFLETTKVIMPIVGFFLAATGARHFRQAADKEICKLED